MPLSAPLPTTYSAAKPLLEQISKIVATVSRNSQGTRRRPQSVRSLTSQQASLGAVLTWNAPVKTKGIVGFRIYKDNETNLLEEVRDPNRRQYRITLPAATTATFFVSSITAQGAESPKLPVVVSSTTDQLVTSGTGGGTNGSQPSPPPNWNNEPSGGGSRRFNF